MTEKQWTERLPVAVPPVFRERLVRAADGTLSPADLCRKTLMRVLEPSERVVRRKAKGK